MKILFVSNEYPPDTGFGGIGTYTRQAAEGLAARGHAVLVLCRSVSGPFRREVQNRVTVCRIPAGSYPLPGGRIFFLFRKACYRHLPQSLVRLAWANSVFEHCAGLINGGTGFDIIEYPECGAEGYRLRNTGIPAVARLHTPWDFVRRFDALKEPLFDVKLQSYLERSSARHAAAVSCPSHALADILARRWNLRSVAVYPNPIATRSCSPTSGGGWIYVGRIERRKGVHVLIRAYAQLCTNRSPPPLLLLGRPYGTGADGRPYGDSIRELLVQLGVAERVRWIEGVPQQDVCGYLCQSSVAFFPSLWENCPYACLEAMAHGLAVVASSCGGFGEIIASGKNGFLVPAEDADGLACLMRRLCDEPGLASALGSAARMRAAREFDADSVCAQAELFYESVIRKARHAS